jgi:hypothetical protein
MPQPPAVMLLHRLRLVLLSFVASLVMGVPAGGWAQPIPEAIPLVVPSGPPTAPQFSEPQFGQFTAPPVDVQRLPAPDEAMGYYAPEVLPQFAGPAWSGVAGLAAKPVPGTDMWYHLGGKGRGYYINDQRIEWTGQEATFAAEGVLDAGIHQRAGQWEWMLESQLFFNMPFDRNILNDGYRESFANNFDIDPFQISQLYVGAQRGNFFFAMGRVPTPFGRYYYPTYRNNFDDSPFIRSEAIIYRETGFLAEWNPAGWNFAAAVTNGGSGQDANSSKAGIFRAGIDLPNFALGASAKIQDGVGSEEFKMYKSHFGVDAMVRYGNWTLSGEAISDRYGFRDAGLDPNTIFWGRSIYYRDYNLVDQKPLRGFGYYVNLGYAGRNWELTLNYGDYYPQDKIGIAAHDTPIHRGFIKYSYHFTPNFEVYGISLVENTVRLPFVNDNRDRIGSMMIFGCQFRM